MGRALVRSSILCSVLALVILVAACSEQGPGENRPTRPNVEGNGGRSSVSISGVVEGYVELLYVPATDQSANIAIGSDLAKMRELMSVAARNQPVDWAAVTVIYKDGSNQKQSSTVRSLQFLALDEVPEVFTNGVAIYGRKAFIDGMISDALAGKGRATGLSDNSRRQIKDRGVQMLQYGLALGYLQDARMFYKNGKAGDAGAAIDAGWATLSGPRENNTPNHGLLATALVVEEDFLVQGRLARPLESYLFQAMVATQQANTQQFEKALAASEGYIRTIFYLAVLRDAKVLAGDSRASDRQVHLAEGWSFFQALKAEMTAASPKAAQTVDAAFSRDATEQFSANMTNKVYAAMNENAVLMALGIPKDFQFTSPAQ